MRESKDLKKLRNKWEGKRIVYVLRDVTDKKSGGIKIDGTYKGIVIGVTNNEALIEDRLEGYDHRNAVCDTGCLIVLADDTNREDFPYISDCKILTGVAGG